MIRLKDSTMNFEKQNIAIEAYSKLFPDAEIPYNFKVVYSGRLKDYGAYVSLTGIVVQFKLSKKWFTISDDIKIGLMQELLLKLLKKKKYSMYIDIYNNFVKNLHIAIPKDKTHPLLEESFDRINERYFLGLVERPNLVWGRFATTTFGSYDFKTDTVTISRVFEDCETIYLDYIMFHEILHKQRKFVKSGSKTYYHDKRFKQREKVFENGEQIEKNLSKVAARAKVRAKATAGLKKKRKPRLFGLF